MVKRLGYDPQIIRENTHYAAVEKTYEIGLDNGRDWTFSVDADVILEPRMVERVLDDLFSSSEDVRVAHPGVIDKLYRLKRWAGIQIYRTDSLEELRGIFKLKKQQRQLKIEGACISELRGRGRKVAFMKRVVGLHDYYQYYRDLYRKFYLNAIRNQEMNRQAMRLWSYWCRFDDDYRVALAAMEKALEESRDLTNSVNDFSREEINETLDRLNLKEKPEMSLDVFLGTKITERVSREAGNIDVHRVFPHYFERSRLWQRLRGFAARRIMSANGG
ncbi:MAG: hypothetical protein WB783_18580 [Arenicellales bacterium]